MTANIGLAVHGGVGLSVARQRKAPWFRANGAPLPLAAYQAIYAKDAAAARLDLTGHGYTLSPQYLAGPGWNGAVGWLYSGSYSEQMWAEFSLAASCSLVARFTYTFYPYGTHVVAGNQDGGNRAYLAPFWSATVGRMYGLGSAFRQVLPGVNSGVMGFAGDRCFYNGVYDGTCAASNLQFTQKFCVGGRGSGNYSSSAYHVGTILCVAVWDHAITDEQMAGVSQAMLAL